ncbi:MAG: hypothetical protein HZB59_06190 [Ignavibacteriales bacterium]|nr:hypothetical protein [Ignavibacteriales bacterium]
MKTYFYLLVLVSILLISCSKKESSPTGSSDDNPIVDNSTIDNVNAANGDISAAIDANDKIHVSYFSFNLGLKYATNKSGSWVTTMIHPEDTTTTMSVYNDIAVDGSGFVHIVYNVVGQTITDTSAIIYATNKSGAWVKTKIAYSVGSSLSGCGIAVTSTGKVHIAYGNDGTDLLYTNNLSGTWSSPARIGSYWANVRPRLALDASNNVYVAYEHGGEGTLHLQTITSAGTLSSNNIIVGVPSSGDDKGWSPDIAINKTNSSVLIPYWNYDDKYLNIYNNGVITKIDSLVNWTEAGIATDVNGKAYISYTNLSTSELYLTTNKTGALVTEKLPVSIKSKSSNVVVESTGKIDIIYCANGVNALKIISK